jgi:rubrerythrin
MAGEADKDSQRYASPACALAEADPVYRGYLPRGELIEFLNMLLEAEQAGVKVANAFLDDAEDAETAALLRDVRRDESRYAALLSRLVRELGGTPSTKVGDFYERAIAIEGMAARLAFLNRGQGWVVKKLRETLPRIAEDAVHAALKEMLATHDANIARCAPFAAQRG